MVTHTHTHSHTHAHAHWGNLRSPRAFSHSGRRPARLRRVASYLYALKRAASETTAAAQHMLPASSICCRLGALCFSGCGGRWRRRRRCRTAGQAVQRRDAVWTERRRDRHDRPESGTSRRGETRVQDAQTRCRNYPTSLLPPVSFLNPVLLRRHIYVR